MDPKMSVKTLLSKKCRQRVPRGVQMEPKMEPKTDIKVMQKGNLLKNTQNYFFAAIYYT